MPWLPSEAIALAERQLGVLARFQLLRWLAEDAVDGHVRRGDLLRLETGVYRLAGGAALPEQRALAAALRARPSAVVTGPFVLGHLRVDGFSPEDPFEVLVSPGRRLSGVGFAHRPDPFPDRAVAQLGEVRLAAPVDALIETACWRPVVDDRRIRVAYDQLRWRGLVRVDRMRRRLEERGELDPGVMAFRQVVDGAELVCESEGERALAPVLSRLEPRPQPQVWVTPKRRVDWYLAALRLAWEYLGVVDHAGAEQRRRDAERDDELAGRGIKVLYVTAADLQPPAAFLAATMGALAVRAEELGVTPPLLLPA